MEKKKLAFEMKCSALFNGVCVMWLWRGCRQWSGPCCFAQALMPNLIEFVRCVCLGHFLFLPPETIFFKMVNQSVTAFYRPADMSTMTIVCFNQKQANVLTIT